VSDPHERSRVPGDFHRFVFSDVQMTLLPVLGQGYWNRAGCVRLQESVVAEVLHFVQDDKFVLVTTERAWVIGDGCVDWGFDGGGG